MIAAWGDIKEAFGYLEKVNLWILALMIPAQFASYMATGEMIFSYLRAKGSIKGLSPLKMTRMSLELNFVNHVLPSGGAAGIAYFSWLLGHHGVSSGRATMAQIIRFGLTFLSFALLLVVALVILIIDHSVDRTTILLSLLLVVLTIGGLIGAMFLLGSKKRLTGFSRWIARVASGFVAWITRGRKKAVVKAAPIIEFFDDIHDDYKAIKREKGILWKPFIWALVANILDVLLIYIAFWSFGVQVSPAIIFIAFGLSSIVSAVSVTPGGAGVYGGGR